MTNTNVKSPWPGPAGLIPVTSGRADDAKNLGLMNWIGIPPLMVLPEIKKALAGSGIEIYVDCSMDTGYDAYKALALGADAVSVGRGILSPLLKEGTKGVENKVRRMNEELSELMIYTGVQDTRSFDPTVIHMA